MSGILPKSAKIRQLAAAYLADSELIAKKCLRIAGSSAAFHEIYEISLATHTLLGKLSSRTLRPPLMPAKSVAVRIPLLVSVGQPSVAQAELRRFVELILWAVYFTDHPVEWKTFSDKKLAGFSRETRRPIAYAARRELAFYLDYAIELMTPEPSGLGKKAVESIKQAVKQLNAEVHAGHLAKATGNRPPHDDLSEKAFRSFAKIHRLTFSSCCLLLAAYRRSSFDKLDALSRAYFDWLIGPKLKKDVRSGPFGLP